MKKAILTLAVLCGIGLMGCTSGTADEANNETIATDTLPQSESELDELAPIGCRPECIFVDGKYAFVNKYGEISEKRYDDVDMMEEAIFAIRNDSVFQIDSLGNEIFDPYQN